MKETAKDYCCSNKITNSFSLASELFKKYISNPILKINSVGPINGLKSLWGVLSLTKDMSSIGGASSSYVRFISLIGPTELMKCVFEDMKHHYLRLV